MQTIEDRINCAISYLKSADTTEYIGEPVSQLEHALQCAHFAEQSNHSEEVILASLFHDIGHFASNTQQRQMADLGIVNHEWIGAKLAYDLGFSPKVALLIGNHVNAKRYLAAKKPNYYERLSSASKQTLIFQGGPMLPDEMRAFELNTLFKEILQVRVNDEKGKIIDLKVHDLNYYRPRIKMHFSKSVIFENNITALPNFVTNTWIEKFKDTLALNTCD